MGKLMPRELKYFAQDCTSRQGGAGIVIQVSGSLLVMTQHCFLEYYMCSAFLTPSMPFALHVGYPSLTLLIECKSSCETLAPSTCLLYDLMAFNNQSWVQIPVVFTDSVTDCCCFHEFLFPGVAEGSVDRMIPSQGSPTSTTQIFLFALVSPLEWGGVVPLKTAGVVAHALVPLAAEGGPAEGAPEAGV